MNACKGSKKVFTMKKKSEKIRKKTEKNRIYWGTLRVDSPKKNTLVLMSTSIPENMSIKLSLSLEQSSIFDFASVFFSKKNRIVPRKMTSIFKLVAAECPIALTVVINAF